MKELSIEEKAQRYDEALTKARNIVNSINVGLIGKDSFEAVFPELAESEDERIRKALIKLVKKAGEGYENVIDGVSIENAIAWLEKQGEQKHQYNSRPKYIGEEELLGEQKPTEWSEEDEEISEAIIKRIKGESEALSVSLSSATSWVGNIKDRVQLQSQWKPSKEQLHILESVIADYDNQGLSYTKDMLCDLYEQLKKL